MNILFKEEKSYSFVHFSNCSSSKKLYLTSSTWKGHLCGITPVVVLVAVITPAQDVKKVSGCAATLGGPDVTLQSKSAKRQL